MFASLITTVLGFAISNLMLFTAEVNEINRLAYQRLNIITQFTKKRTPKITTAQRQSARRNLFRRHHQKTKKTM